MGAAASSNWGDAFGDLGLCGRDQDALRDELQYRKRQFQIQAFEEQKLFAKHLSERLLLETGEMKLQVHPYFYHYWGQRLGYECWEDETFVREFIRDNEEVRVKNRSRKLMIGHSPRPGAQPAQPRKERFHKVYA